MKRAKHLVLGALLAACGARTGLLVPAFDAAASADAPGEVAVPDAVAPDAGGDNRVPLPCIDGQFSLARRSVDVMLVIDRSGSMAQDIDGGHGRPRKWDLLRSALRSSLPRFDAALSFGATAFPRRFDGNLSHSCQLGTTVDVVPAARNAAAVLDLLDTTEPWGATPTFDAMRVTGEQLVAEISRVRSVAMILATDGGPNCNPDLDPDTCACTSVDPMGRPYCGGSPSVCLDDVRSAALVAGLATRGAPTWVIGLDAAAQTAERSALERLARAGGHPNTRGGAAAYYSVRNSQDLTAAFEAIEQEVATCTLVTPSRPDAPDRMQVFLGNGPIARDTTHAGGWDWVDRDYGQLAFYGEACARVAAAMAPPRVVVACR